MTRTRTSWLAALLCALALATGMAARADAPPPGIVATRTLGAINGYELPGNGLQVLLLPQPNAPRTSVTMIYRVGSRNEQAKEAGMAHLLEHVTFRGTAEYPDLGAALQSLGASYNGTTSMDRTNYSSSFVPDDKTLREVLKLEASRMRGARLAQGDFDKEKPIVLNEMGLRAASVPAQVMQALIATAFRQHPYGRPVVGFTADIENLSLPVLRAFYERYYRPDNAVLMVAGGFDPVRALAAIAEIYGPMTQDAAPLPPPELAEPNQVSPRVTTLRTRETALAAAYRVPGMAHPDAPALAVLSAMLGSAFSQDRTLAYSQAAVPASLFTRDPFLLGQVVLVPGWDSGSAKARDEVDYAEDGWLHRLEGIRPNEAMVHQAASQIAANLRRILDDPVRAPALISDAVGAGDWRLPFKWIDEFGKLKAEDVTAAAKLYLRPENRSVVRGVTDPAVTTTETRDVPVGFFAGLFSKPIDVAGVKDPSAGMADIPRMASTALAVPIDAFDTDPAALDRNTVRSVLSGGLAFGLLPKHLSDERVAVRMVFRWGSAADVANLQGWRVLGTLLEDGTSHHTADEIRQLKASLQLNLRVVSLPQELVVSMSARRSTLGPALRLVKEMLSEPRLPELAFERERNRALAALQANASDAALDQARRYHMAQLGLQPGDPGYEPSAAELAELWRRMTVDDASDFQRRFWSANEGYVAVVGTVPDKLTEMVDSLFGRWKQPEAPRFQRHVPAHVDEAGARFISINSAGAGSGSALVSLNQEIPLERHGEDYFPLLVGLRILVGNGEPAGSRLADRLRAQDALSYRITHGLQVPAYGDRAALHLDASGAPESALRVEAAMKEEIARLLKDGVTAEEVDAARRRLQADRRQWLSSEAGLASEILGQIEHNSDFRKDQAEQDAALAAVTPERVQQVMNRLLRPDGWLVVVTGAAKGE